jgi:hypothetical protein
MQNRSWATDLIVEQAASDCIPPPHVALAAGLRLVRRANNMHIGSIPFLRERHNFFAVIVGSPAFVPAGVFCSARRTIPASGRDGQFFRRQRTVAALSYYPISCLPLSLADRCRAWFSGQRTLSMIFDRLHGALPWERVIDKRPLPGSALRQAIDGEVWSGIKGCRSSASGAAEPRSTSSTTANLESSS